MRVGLTPRVEVPTVKKSGVVVLNRSPLIPETDTDPVDLNLDTKRTLTPFPSVVGCVKLSYRVRRRRQTSRTFRVKGEMEFVFYFSSVSIHDHVELGVGVLHGGREEKGEGVVPLVR